MHTLSVFPQLLSFSLVSPFIIRIAIALFLLFLGYERWNKPMKWSLIVPVLSGAFLLVGLYTQIAVIIGVIALKLEFYFDFYSHQTLSHIAKKEFFLYGIAGIALLSLLFTGPGFLAFDWPL